MFNNLTMDPPERLLACARYSSQKLPALRDNISLLFPWVRVSRAQGVGASLLRYLSSKAWHIGFVMLVSHLSDTDKCET